MRRELGILKTELELVSLNWAFPAVRSTLNYHSANKEQSNKMENFLLGAKAYICDEHDFVANKRKVVLLDIRLIPAVLTGEAVEFKQQSNYNHVG